MEGEETPIKIPGFDGGDRTSLDLPADQQSLLDAVKSTGKPLVMVTMSGSPLNLDWAKANADAVLQAWYPGEQGGNAVGRVLSGAANPSGRLPLTFYRTVDDLPAFSDYATANRTYRYFKGGVVYPFGYGLSYTTFDYAPLMIGKAGDAYMVTTAVTNTGQSEGDEVVQLYLTFPDVPGAPRIALRGFQRVHLKPGQTQRVAFSLSPRDVSSVTPEGRRRVAAGTYGVSVGSG